MNVPTANVIVAFDKATMEKLFSAGATYSSLVKEVSDGNADALLFNNVSNPNFISFEHSHDYGKGFKMVLEFIDPKGEFERRFISTNPAKIIKSLSNSKLETSNNSIVDENRQLRKSLVKLNDADINEIKSRLQEEEGSREFFVAYGVGKDLSLWSGPHRTVLTNVDVEVKGSRKIKLDLTPTINPLDISNRRGAYNEKINLNLYGLSVRFSGNSQELKFKESPVYDPLQYLEDFKQKEDAITFKSDVSQGLKNLGFGDIVSQVEKFDFHCIVVDCIRNYVQKATNNKNVIVLLPNINVLCRQAIADHLITFNEAAPRQEGFSSFSRAQNPDQELDNFLSRAESIAGGDQQPPDEPAGVVAEEGESLDSFLGRASEPPPPPVPSAFNPEARAKLDYIANEYVGLGNSLNFIKGMLEKFGLKVTDTASANTTEKPKGQGLITYFNEAEKGSDPNDRFEKFFGDKTYYATLNVVGDNLPDHVQVLSDVFKKINSMCRDAQKINIRTLGMTETQLDLLKIWGNTESGGKWGKSWTFAGYDDFEEDGTAVIVGDDSLIKQFLYGATNTETTKDTLEKLGVLAARAQLRRAQSQESVEAFVEEVDSGKEAEELELTILSEMPLHPLDRAVLTDKQYNSQVREITYPKVNKSLGPFGPLYELPDTFSLQDEQFTDSVQNKIIESGIPVFRYNTPNPNIVDLNFKFGGIYLGALKFGYAKKAARNASRIAEGAYPSNVADFPIRGIGAAIAYLRGKGYANNLGSEEQKSIIELLSNKISPDLVDSLNVNNEQEAAKTLAALLLSTEKHNLRGVIEMDQYLSDTPNNILADIANDLYRKAVTMGITTLPMFHISNYSDLGSPCIVFAQDQNISQTLKPERTTMNRFFSGLFRFTGFKHTISTSNVFSDFKLTKNQADYSNE